MHLVAAGCMLTFGEDSLCIDAMLFVLDMRSGIVWAGVVLFALQYYLC